MRSLIHSSNVAVRRLPPLKNWCSSIGLSWRRSLFAFAALFMLAACNDNFDPRAPLDSKIVVFSVLSTDRDMQFVTVQRNYMPNSFDPVSYSSDNSLNDALVTLRESNRTYVLRDTVLARPDTSRFRFPIRTYYLTPFVPTRGKTYQLLVQSPTMGQAWATITVPSLPKITLKPDMVQILDRPDRYGNNVPIIYIIQLSNGTKGYLARLLLYYDVLKSSEWVEERAEIPITSADSASFSLDIPIYPQMTAAPQTSQIGLIYRTGYYRGIINRLNEKYKSTNLIFKWATLVVLQADQNLFDYYSSTHASQDPFSIRLDEPSVSGINGGLGMAGAYTLDSLVNILPEKFWGNR